MIARPANSYRLSGGSGGMRNNRRASTTKCLTQTSPLRRSVQSELLVPSHGAVVHPSSAFFHGAKCPATAAKLMASARSMVPTTSIAHTPRTTSYKAPSASRRSSITRTPSQNVKAVPKPPQSAATRVSSPASLASRRTSSCQQPVRQPVQQALSHAPSRDHSPSPSLPSSPSLCYRCPSGVQSSRSAMSMASSYIQSIQTASAYLQQPPRKAIQKFAYDYQPRRHSHDDLASKALQTASPWRASSNLASLTEVSLSFSMDDEFISQEHKRIQLPPSRYTHTENAYLGSTSTDVHEIMEDIEVAHLMRRCQPSKDTDATIHSSHTSQTGSNVYNVDEPLQSAAPTTNTQSTKLMQYIIGVLMSEAGTSQPNCARSNAVYTLYRRNQ